MSTKEVLIKGHDDVMLGAQQIFETQQTLEEFTHESIDEMSSNVIDASPESHLAETLVSIMYEFAHDGEAFQPSVDPELREFLFETLERVCPEATQTQIAQMISEARDFPPVNVHERFDLAA